MTHLKSNKRVKNVYINFPNQEVKSLVSPFFPTVTEAENTMYLPLLKTFFFRVSLFVVVIFFTRKVKARAVTSQIRIIQLNSTKPLLFRAESAFFWGETAYQTTEEE